MPLSREEFGGKPVGVTTLVPWYGSNRTNAAEVGQLLAGCKWVGIPFAGGMCELRHITARTIVVSDLHRHVLNLATELADDLAGPRMIRHLRRYPFHEDTLSVARELCGAIESGGIVLHDPADLAEWAEQYFIVAWMGRNGTAGTPQEFTAGLSHRWDAGGGDSAVRYRSAVEALRDWRRIFPRCTFLVRDVFDFLKDVQDEAGHGLYCDPPFPGPGDKYTHTFGHAKQVRLADELTSFKKCRVVCRFYDHPLVRELYPESRWTWHRFDGRTQANGVGPEVLLVNQTPEV
jgi:site-specific DNA-adenine methylase